MSIQTRSLRLFTQVYPRTFQLDEDPETLNICTESYNVYVNDTGTGPGTGRVRITAGFAPLYYYYEPILVGSDNRWRWQFHLPKALYNLNDHVPMAIGTSVWLCDTKKYPDDRVKLHKSIAHPLPMPIPLVRITADFLFPPHHV